MRLLIQAIISAATGALLGWLLSRLFGFLLFHAEEARFLLGRRLPFTPGLWISRRESIATFVGSLFAEELASGDILRERLRDEGTKEEFEKGIAERLDPILERPLGSILQGVAAEDPRPARLAAGAIEKLLGSQELARALEAAFAEALSLVKDIPLSAILPPERARDLASSFLSGESLKEFAEGLHGWIEGSRAGSLSEGIGGLPALSSRSASEGGGAENLVAGLLSTRSLSPLIGLFVDALYDAAIPLVEAFLNDIDTRDRIEEGAREIVRRAINRLNVMQRLIVGAANYERSIAETMPETIEDLVSMVSSLLRSPSMRERTRRAALESWDSKDGAGLGLISRIGLSLSREALWRAVSAVLGRLVEEGPAVADRLASLAAAGRGLTISSLLGALGLGPEKVAAFGRLDLDGLLASDSLAGAALLRSREAFLASFSEAISSRTLADILELDRGKRLELSSWLADASLSMLEAEADSIVAGLGIQGLVVKKLRSIGNGEVRRLLKPAMSSLSRILILALAAIGFLEGLINPLLAKMWGG